MAHLLKLTIPPDSSNKKQVMFGKAATNVECLVCGKVLAEPSGGKSKIKARILEVLE